MKPAMAFLIFKERYLRHTIENKVYFKIVRHVISAIYSHQLLARFPHHLHPASGLYFIGGQSADYQNPQSHLTLGIFWT
jgi:hypothetical protein